MKKMNCKIKTAIITILFFLLYYLLNFYTGFAIFCPIYKISGYYCPGCGMTRLLFSIMKLDIYQAFRYNTLVFILIILGIIYLIVKKILKKFNIYITIPNYILYMLIVIIIIYGVLRNIPGFDWLAPTKV